MADLGERRMRTPWVFPADAPLRPRPKWLQVFWLGLTAVVPIYTVVVVAMQMQRLK